MAKAKEIIQPEPRTKIILKYVLFLTLLIVPFLTSELNEQSPFEFIKLFTISISSILALVFFLGITLTKESVKIRWNHGLTLVGLILLVNTLSFSFSNQISNSFWADINVPTDSLLTIIIFFIFCFLVSQVLVSKLDILKVNFVLLFAGTLLAAYGIVQHFGLDPIDWWGYSSMRSNAYGTIGQAVGFGTILGTLLPLALISFLNSKTKWMFVSGLVSVACISLGILYSGSRSPALASLVVAVFAVALYLFKNKNRMSLKKSLVVILVIALAQVAYFFENDQSTLTQKLNSNVIANGLSERTYIWQDALKIWSKYPILGSGPETFATEQKMVNRKEHNQFEHWELTWTKAHNHYIHHLATTGLLGLLSELILIFFLLYDFFKLIRKRSFEDDDLLGAGYALGFFFICVTNLTAFNFVLTQLYSYLLPTLYFILRFMRDPKVISLKSKKWLNFFILIVSVVLLGELLLSIYQYWKSDVLFGKSKREFLLDKNIEKSLKDIDESIILQSANPRPYCRKATILFGLLTNNPNKYNQEQVADTVKLIDELTDSCVTLDLNNAENWSIRGKIFEELYRGHFIDNTAIAEKSFLQAEKVNPNNPTFYYRLALIYLNTNRIPEYLKNMNEAIDLKDDYLPAYTDLLGFFYRRGDKNQVDYYVQKLLNIKFDKPEFIDELKNMVNLADINKDEKSKNIITTIYLANRHLTEAK